MRVTTDYITEDGAKIRDLERWQCSSCGANFFDIDAADRVVLEEKSVKIRPKIAQASARAK
jgi:hypothetical protein